MKHMLEMIEIMLVAALAWIVLSGCTSHTRYYSTDGTTVAEFERTTTIGTTEQHFDKTLNATDIP